MTPFWKFSRSSRQRPRRVLSQCNSSLLEDVAIFRFAVAGFVFNEGPGIASFMVVVQVGQEARLTRIGLK